MSVRGWASEFPIGTPQSSATKAPDAEQTIVKTGGRARSKSMQNIHSAPSKQEKTETSGRLNLWQSLKSFSFRQRIPLNSSTFTAPTQTWKPSEKANLQKPQDVKIGKRGEVKSQEQTPHPNLEKKSQNTQSRSLLGSVRSSFRSLKESLESPMQKTARESMPAILAKAEKEGVDTKKKHLQKDIQKTIEVAAKTLAPGEFTKVKVADQQVKLFVQKTSEGKLDIYIKEKKLGAGAFGKVFLAVRPSGEKVSLKLALMKADMTDFEKEDLAKALQTEVETLELLNADGEQEGVQELVKMSEYKKDGVENQKVLTGKVYSNGDFANQKAALGLQRLFGDEKIKPHVRLRNVNLKMKELEEFFTQKMVEKSNVSMDKALSKEEKQVRITEIHQEIDKELTFLINISKDLVSKEKHKELEGEFMSFIHGLEHRSDFNPYAEFTKVSTLLHNNLSAAVKKEVKIPDMKKRMFFAGNLVNGLNYLSSKGIVHGDIKPQNFFWNDEKAVIADFGSAQRINGSHPVIATTIGYMPTEYINAMNFYAGKAKEYRNKAEVARNDGNEAEAKKFEKEAQKQEENWKRAGTAGDIRSTGISNYQLLTGGPIPKDDKNATEEERKAFFDPNTYANMRDEMKAGGIDPDAAEIMAKMSIPFKMEVDSTGALKFPEIFPLPVTDKEREDLAKFLKNPVTKPRKKASA